MSKARHDTPNEVRRSRLTRRLFTAVDGREVYQHHYRDVFGMFIVIDERPGGLNGWEAHDLDTLPAELFLDPAWEVGVNNSDD